MIEVSTGSGVATTPISWLLGVWSLGVVSYLLLAALAINRPQVATFMLACFALLNVVPMILNIIDLFLLFYTMPELFYNYVYICLLLCNYCLSKWRQLLMPAWPVCRWYLQFKYFFFFEIFILSSSHFYACLFGSFECGSW